MADSEEAARRLAEETFPEARAVIRALQTIPSVKDGEPVILLAPIQRIIDAYGLARERAGLEKAAKAVCPGCANDGRHGGTGCKASAIRALMDPREE